MVDAYWQATGWDPSSHHVQIFAGFGRILMNTRAMFIVHALHADKLIDFVT